MARSGPKTGTRSAANGLTAGSEFLEFMSGHAAAQIAGGRHEAVVLGGLIAGDELIHAVRAGQTHAEILTADLHSLAAGWAFLNEVSGGFHI